MDIALQLFINSLAAAALYALLGMSFSFVYSPTKFFNLAHGAIAVFGGYMVFLFHQRLNWNLYAAIVLSIILAGIAGWMLEVALYQPLRRKKVSNMILLVASLGAFTAMQALLAIAFTSQFISLFTDVAGQVVYQIGPAAITQIQVLMITAAIAVLIFLSFILKKTVFGKTLRAISDDEEVSKIVGINTDKTIGWTFFIGSCIAGLAGILVGFDSGLVPTMGLPLLLGGVIASIVGGMGSVWGGFLGGLLSALVANFGVWKISGEWKDTILFGVLILFLIFRPRGILNR